MKKKILKKYAIKLMNKTNKKFINVYLDSDFDKLDNYINNEKNISFGLIRKINREKINEYIKNNKKYYHNFLDDKRECRTYKRLLKALKKLRKTLKNDFDVLYIAGGITPYLLLNENSNRLHDDIDCICMLEDINELRNIIKQTKYYNSEWDSLNYAKDNKDYGFEFKINGVPVGIYPFSYSKNILLQYTFDPYTKNCKIKKIELMDINDYVHEYKSKNGIKYKMMSLEYIKLSKDNSVRPKDKIDSKKIEETNLIREDVMKRINNYKEIQNTTF